MLVRREFRDKVVKRTKRVGNAVVVIFKNEQKGQPGERVVVPLAQYLEERRVAYRPHGRPVG